MKIRVQGGVGTAGTGAVKGSADWVGTGASVCCGMTDELPPLPPIKASEKDVMINMIAAPVVSLPRKLPGPLLPKMV